MRRGLLLVLLIPAALAAATLEPDADVLRIDATDPVRICMDCAPQRAMFPVSVLPKAGSLALTDKDAPLVIGVSTSTTRIQQLEDRFHASWQPVTGEPQWIVLTINPPLRDPGTYDVVLNLFPTRRPQAPRKTVKLIVAPAVLQVPEKLLVHRTLRWPLKETIESTPLLVYETGRAAAIESLRFMTMPFANGNEPVEGSVEGTVAKAASKTPSPDVPAGESARVTIMPKGDFPLGLSSGAVLIAASELAAPIKIPIDVRSEITPVYLAVSIVAGLILSWWVKVVLQKRLQVNQARAAAATLLTLVDADRSSYRDSIFLEAIEQSRTALLAATAADDAAAIEKARADLDTKWRDARKSLEDRRTSLRTQLEGQERLLSAAWELPPEVVPVLASTKTDLAAAAQMDLAGDPTSALTALGDAMFQASSSLQQSGRKWQQTSRQFFDHLFSAKTGVSDAILSPLQTASNGWRGVYNEIAVTAGDPTLVQPLLRQIAGEYLTVRDHLRELPRLLRREFQSVSQELSANGADANLVAAVDTHLAALEPLLAAAADNPEGAVSTLDGALDGLQKAWMAAFESATTADKATAKKVRDLVTARDFRTAATFLGGAAVLSVGDSTTASIDAFQSTVRAAPPVGDGRLLFGTLPDAGPYAALLLESAGRIKSAKLQQTLIVGGMFLLWAMTTSSGAFDGTVRSLLLAVFSAFSLDVGIDTLVSRVKGTLLG